MATAPQQQALASLKDLLTSGDYSDLTITCGQGTYKVHKAIVCSRAGFFALAVRFGGQEPKSGVVDLPGDELEIVKFLVQYLYEADYNPVLPTDNQVKTTVAATPRVSCYRYDFPHSCRPGYDPFNQIHVLCTKRNVCPHHFCTPYELRCCYDFSCEFCEAPSSPPPPPAGKAQQLLLHAKMYETGDKYEVKGLKDLAKDKFEASCKHFWNTSSFAVAARHAFSTTIEDYKGLRNIVSATISEHLELVDDPEVGAVMTEFNGLALSILQATIGEQGCKK